MSHPALQVLASLQAAICARAVYGADHASVGTQSRLAIAAVETTLASHTPLTLLFVDDRIVCDSHPIPGRPAQFAELTLRLREHGIDALTFTRVPDPAELASLLVFLAGPPTAAQPTLHAMALGRTHLAAEQAAAPAASGTPAEGNPAALAPDVNAVWSVLQSGAVDGATEQALPQLVLNICAGVASSKASILRLAAVKDLDEYTFVHTINVSIQSAALAEAIGLSTNHIHQIVEAGLLHDIGKAAVPDGIIRKKGPLDAQERAIMQRHPVDGAAMLLANASSNELAAIVAFEHHMHIDGSGYPAPRRKHRPHLATQIVQLADIFDAMRTHRPYRAALPHEKAMEIMWQDAGTKFDRDLLTVFFECVAVRAAVPTPAPEQAPPLAA